MFDAGNFVAQYVLIEKDIEELKSQLEQSIGSSRIEGFHKGLALAQEEFEESSREMLVVKNAEEMYNNYYQCDD